MDDEEEVQVVFSPVKAKPSQSMKRSMRSTTNMIYNTSPIVELNVILLHAMLLSSCVYLFGYSQEPTCGKAEVLLKSLVFGKGDEELQWR